MLFAYFGPETFLPLTSVLAGAVGVMLMFGRTSWRFAKDGAKALARGLGLAKKSNIGTTPRRAPGQLPKGGAARLRRDPNPSATKSSDA